MKEKDWKDWSQSLKERASQWLNQEANRTQKGYICGRCGEYLVARIVYCSVHEDGGSGPSEEHIGFGRVRTLKIPECPTEHCSNHRPDFWDEHLRLENDALFGPCIDC